VPPENDDDISRIHREISEAEAGEQEGTKHGHETNIGAHYLPEFTYMQLSDITVEAVQNFISQKAKKGKTMKPGPIWHETLLGRRFQPVADGLGLPHITWRLLRNWGATQMVEERVPIKRQRSNDSVTPDPIFFSSSTLMCWTRQPTRLNR
jgi:hypothetical protein